MTLKFFSKNWGDYREHEMICEFIFKTKNINKVIKILRKLEKEKILLYEPVSYYENDYWKYDKKTGGLKK